MGIFVFTASKDEAQKNLDKSIKNEIDFHLISSSLTAYEHEVVTSLKAKYGLYAWGAVYGSNNLRTWNKLTVGDFVLTMYNKEFHFLSRVLYKTINADAAEELWGVRKETKDTWELMYFLSEPIPILSRSVLSESFLTTSYQGFSPVSAEVVSKIENNYSSLDKFFNTEFTLGKPLKTFKNPQDLIENIADNPDFNPKDKEDAKRKVLRAITQREGQPRFRKELIDAYDNRCAISGSDVLASLEAAHILPYNGNDTNHIQNGILLRADLHTLFDRGLITVTFKDGNYEVILSPDVRSSSYSKYHGQPLKIPVDEKSQPSLAALNKRNSAIPWL